MVKDLDPNRIKDPRAVLIGRAGGRARWAGHAPRLIYVEDLAPEERRLISAIVAAVRDKKTAEAAAQTDAPARSTAEASTPETGRASHEPTL